MPNQSQCARVTGIEGGGAIRKLECPFVRVFGSEIPRFLLGYEKRETALARIGEVAVLVPVAVDDDLARLGIRRVHLEADMLGKWIEQLIRTR